MKILVTTVGTIGPQDEKENKQRLETAQSTIEKAVNMGADIIALPGGYYSVSKKDDRIKISERMIQIAKQHNIGIVFGIDQETKNTDDDEQRLRKNQTLPYFDSQKFIRGLVRMYR